MRMETLQIRLPEKQVDEIDEKVRKGVYASRSEAIRTMLREFESIEETFAIMSNPKFVADIKQGLKEIREGKGIKLEDL